MIAKNERFEMRLDTDLLVRIDEWRSKQDSSPSRAEAARYLIEEGLSLNSTYHLQISKVERLNTWLLTEILKCQKNYGDEDKKSVELIQNAIIGGHLWALDWELGGVVHEHTDDRAALSLVVNTLDMWNFIERGYAELSAVEKKTLETTIGPTGTNPSFFGFDGNHESEHMGIASFLINEMGRFPRFKGRDLNSHMPLVSRYRAMTSRFDGMRKHLVGRELTADEIIKLLDRTEM